MATSHSRPTPSPRVGAGRNPDFVIVGAMKAGTTSLFRWIGAHPGARLPVIKEPHFFSDPARWERGPAWYRSHFAGSDGFVTGEASASYTHPAHASLVAERLAAMVPGVRIVYVVRHPVARLVSHYRHEVLRGRERRSFAEAVASEPSYVGRSCYWSCIEPFVTAFEPDQVMVVDIEDLQAGSDEWAGLLGHLGLAIIDRPDEVHNQSTAKARYTGPMRWLWERGLTDRAGSLPPSVRRLGRRLLLRAAPADQPGPPDLDPALAGRMWADVLRLEEWRGRGFGWERT